MAAMRPIRQGPPGRVNHHTPSPVAAGVRDSFAQDVERAVDVRVEAAPIAGAEQAAFGGVIRHQAVRLAIQVWAVLRRRDPRVHATHSTLGRRLTVGADPRTMMAPVVA